MDKDGRRHLAELMEEALADGFERFEIERTVRELEGVYARGWRIKVGGGVAGEISAERFVLDEALEDSRYLPELRGLLGMWALHGIPKEDRPGYGRDGEEEEVAHRLRDRAFLVRFLSACGPRQLDVARTLLGAGADIDNLARDFREAFEDEDDESDAEPPSSRP